MAERTGVTRIPVLRRWNLSPRESAILAAIVLATIAIYLPSLRNGWVFDDWDIFVTNKILHSWSFVWNSLFRDKFWFRNPARLPQSEYYRPVESTYIAASALLLGTHPAAWHLSKIVLHIITVVLCFRVAQLLSGSVGIGLLTAAIYGVMPAHVDAVVWLSAISEPLSTAFELGALLWLIGRQPGWSRGMLCALGLYACAQLTHESAILFPLVVAAYVFLFERGANQQLPGPSQNAGTIRSRIIAAARVSAPFGALALAYLCARLAVLGLHFAFSWPRPTGPVHLGQMASPAPHRPVDFILTMPVVLLTDLGVLAVPGVAGPVHAVHWITRASPIAFVAAGVFVILAAAALVLVWRSSDRRLYLFCAVWSLLALAPALKLNSIWELVQDRYLYAPSFGWSLAVAVAAVRLAAASPRARAAVGTAMALLLAAYMVTAIRIEHYWRDDVSFFGQCVAVDPTNLDYRLDLVIAMNKAGDFEGAAQALERGTAIHPNNVLLQKDLAQQYQKMGRQLDFAREFRKFIKLSNAASQRRRAAESSDASQPASAP
ncbi:hypothetical protein [Candidatus Binatus sp.]|uniref:tetratricopeptide repeat protein n=1 Tax=Candidatus Binatus sp. TaxID=2811406 RepID=UPI003C54835F